MSSTNNKKYTVILYQAGLGSDHTHFDDTFIKIEKFKRNKHMVFKAEGKNLIDSFIDMSKFDTDKGYFYGLNTTGYMGKSTELENNFNNIIRQIIDILKDNPNKVLHVRTCLTNSVDFDDGFDSIEHQKKKLKYIINALHSYDINVNINLVGHSQGGLVNIETAIEIPNLIKNIVSISTPYEPVSFGRDLLYIDRLLKILKLGGIITDENPKILKRYEESVETLVSNNYYNNLKNRWGNLTSRPQLLVITGTSGHIAKNVFEYVKIGSSGSIRMNFLRKYPFDGVVATHEQRAIEHDFEINFADENLPCFKQKTYIERNCGASIYDRCKNCQSPYFDFFTSVFEIAMDVMKGNKPLNNDIINAIWEGISRDNLTNVSYKNYYDIYASEYSHKYLAQHNAAILTIMGFVE